MSDCTWSLDDINNTQENCNHDGGYDYDSFGNAVLYDYDYFAFLTKVYTEYEYNYMEIANDAQEYDCRVRLRHLWWACKSTMDVKTWYFYSLVLHSDWSVSLQIIV